MNAWYTLLPSLLQQPPATILITAADYPPLFSSWLIAQFKQHNHQVIALELNTSTLAELHMQISSSFLGNRSTYWLGNIAELDAAAYKQLVQLLDSYTGPHTLIFFVAADERRTLPAAATTITLPVRITQDEFIALAQLYGLSLPERSSSRQLIQQLFGTYQTMSVEQAMLIMEYLPLVGKSAAAFIQEWVPRILVSEQSLFALSQAFFAKNQQHCLLLWHQIQDQYGEQFWTAYWSEQLFRAYFVAKALQTHDKTLDIRRLSARLPFSFIKRDYKRWRLQELVAAHEYITRIELDLKSGASSWQLDTFYLKTLTL